MSTAFTQSDFEKNRLKDGSQRMFGDWGLPPHEPCRTCGGKEFHTMDWNMGYVCGECHTTFGTKEEWHKYKRGEPR